MEQDYYKILQVAPEASDDVIEAAYRTLARRYHPDSPAAGASEEKMKELNRAYYILRDPIRRAEYDEERRQSASPPAQVYSAPPAPVSRPPFTTPAWLDFTAQETPTEEAKPAPQGQHYSLLVLGIMIAFALFLLVLVVSPGQSNRVGDPSGQGTAAAGLLPTATLQPTPSPEPSPTPGCYPWTAVTDDQVGADLCVFGRIVMVSGTNIYQQILRFSEQPGTFLIRGRTRGFSGMVAGKCIAVTGKILRSGAYLYQDAETSQVVDFEGCP